MLTRHGSLCSIYGRWYEQMMVGRYIWRWGPRCCKPSLQESWTVPPLSFLLVSAHGVFRVNSEQVQEILILEFARKHTNGGVKLADYNYNYKFNNK
jgi:hypothetical protein